MSRVNLFLIGVNKAGTSWLYYLLAHHPDVFMAEAKELYFFGDEGKADEGPSSLADYHSHFPFTRDLQYYGDATVMYYRSADTAEAIQRYNADAQVLAIVRDPIQRLRSQFQYHKQIGLLDEGTTLGEALDGRDPQLLRDSHYERTLPAYEERFGPDQFKLVSLEAGRDHPDRLWQDLLTFLDLRSAPRPSEDDRPENPTGSAAFRWVYRHTVRPLRTHFPGAYRHMLESTWARRAKLGLLRLLGTANKTSIPTALQHKLEDEFAPTYAYLQDRGFSHYGDG